MFQVPSSRFFVVEPKTDPLFKMLGKYDRLFEECDIEELTRLPKGWHQQIVELAEVLDQYTRKEKFPGFRFLRISEFNGELLIEQHCDDSTTNQVIAITKQICKNICQICGELGEETVEGGRKSILCGKHKMQKRIKSDAENDE